MVTVYTDKSTDTAYLIPSSDTENAEILKHPIPGDFWVNIESSKRLPVYARQNSNQITDVEEEDEDNSKEEELPRHIAAVCSYFLQQQNPKKQIKQLSWCQLSTTTSFVKCPKHTARYSKADPKEIAAIEATKITRANVDFEAEQSEYLAKKLEENSKKYHQNKKTELENSRTYREIAEMNRKGYTDLYDEEAIQMSSNQNRDEDWEDDFM